MSNKVRVRFAPSPTGFMHLGNISVALMNYLFARQKRGSFVLRVEDTDKFRNLNEAGLQILQDLKWLGIQYTEGPIIGGEFGPYYQSERSEIYKKQLNELISANKVYRCFCTKERLDKMRDEQLKSGQPPRYDRRCLNLSADVIKQKIIAGLPFIWRFKVNEKQVFDLNCMARGKTRFEMKNFSDFALTRHDGSFTFMFANFVDDWLMQITNVIRGEDHLSNTAMQAALYDAFSVQMPTFWHLPMLCNVEGKKLSKRDFGFSLEDLKHEGFLPQAICNYLAIVGSSFEQEIQSLGELSKSFDFDNIRSTGAIRYDLEKLTWINHKWIERISSERLFEFASEFLYEQIPVSQGVSQEKLEFLLQKVKTDLKTLKDVGSVLGFYFDSPETSFEEVRSKIGEDKALIVIELIKKNIDNLSQTEFFLDNLKSEGKERGLKIRDIFGTIRYLLTGKFQGIGIHDLFEMLEVDKIRGRLKKVE